jgi:hypothetical protein
MSTDVHNLQVSITDPTPITGVTKEGKRVWYTGKSGPAFVSENHKDAFLGYTMVGARRRAAILNGMTKIHGIHFVAVAGDLLEVFKMAIEGLYENT